jgi:hypothetical protein
MSGAFLNSVTPYLKSQKEERVTAVVAQTRYHKMKENQFQQRSEHSAGHHTSNTAINVLLDSGSDGDLMFHEKGTPMHFPYLAMMMQTANFLAYIEWKIPHYRKEQSQPKILLVLKQEGVLGDTRRCKV